MQMPGMSLQTFPKEQLRIDFTNTSSSTFQPFYLCVQLSVFKLENSNLAFLELTDTGTGESA